AQGFALLIGDDEGVLRVARRVVGREVQGFEVVEVGFDLRSQTDGVSPALEDRDDLGHGLDEGMFDAEAAGDAGEGDVKVWIVFDGVNSLLDGKREFNLFLESVEPLTNELLRFRWRGLQPQVSDFFQPSLLTA